MDRPYLAGWGPLLFGGIWLHLGLRQVLYTVDTRSTDHVFLSVLRTLCLAGKRASGQWHTVILAWHLKTDGRALQLQQHRSLRRAGVAPALPVACCQVSAEILPPARPQIFSIHPSRKKERPSEIVRRHDRQKCRHIVWSPLLGVAAVDRLHATTQAGDLLDRANPSGSRRLLH